MIIKNKFQDPSDTDKKKENKQSKPKASFVSFRELMFLDYLQLLPNIVRIESTTCIDGFYYVLLEQCCYDLNVARQGTSSNESMQIAMSVLEALSYIHLYGIYHLDVKPANILWTHDDKIKLWNGRA